MKNNTMIPYNAKKDLETNYYNKTEVELLVAGGSGGSIDLSNYYKKLETYSKAEVDDLIAGGGADLSDYYTKAEVDDLISAITETDLSNYYNKTEVYNKLESYSKAEVDALIEIDNAVALVNNGVLTKNILIDTMYCTLSHRTIATNENVIEAIKTGSREITVSNTTSISTLGKYDHASISILYPSGMCKTYITNEIDITTGIVTLDRDLEETTTLTFMATHQNLNGQHLSSYGYIALAQYIYDNTATYKKIDKVIFKLNPYTLKGGATWSDINIYNLDSTLFLPMTKVGGLTGGGYVANTNGTLSATCGLAVSLNPDTSSSMRNRYRIRNGTKGQGFSFLIPKLSKDGYIELGCGLDYTTSYTFDGVLRYTRGSVNIKVLDQNNNTIYSTVFSSCLSKLLIPLEAGIGARIEFTLAENTPTVFSLNDVLIWEGSLAINKLNNKSVGLIGDSWTQYPLVSNEYPQKPHRPYDGLLAEGYQYLSKKIEEYSLLNSNAITTFNYGRGGQTSEWGKYWTKNLKNNSINFGLILFFTNDNNSVNNYSSNTVSSYDFSPSNAYSQLNSNNGGIFGSVNYDIWLLNILNISKQVSGMGAIPIIVLPSHTGSSAQTSSHMNMYGMMIEYLN